MGLLDFLKKKKKLSKSNDDADYIKNNWRKLVPYWGAIIAGDEMLEDGTKFDSHVIYNPKLLRYEKRYLELSSIMAAKSTKDKNLIENVRTCYMYFANFDESVKAKHKTSTSKITDLVMGEKNQEKLIKKLAAMDYDEEKAKKENSFLNEQYLNYIKKFDEIVKKS